MTLSLTYESDFKHIKQAILEIREMLKNHQGIANQSTEYRDEYRQSKLVSTEDYQGVKRTSLVYMDTFSDSSIDILVYCFSRTVAWDEWLAVKEDVMFKIADILKKNHLEFAYPTLTLHQVKEDEVG
jgi:MscS family membrane protein